MTSLFSGLVKYKNYSLWLALLTSILLFPFFKNYLLIARDQFMFLYAGKLILMGKIPFIDFFEVNSPAIMYFSAAVIQISGWLHWSLFEFYKFLYFSYFIMTLFWIGNISFGGRKWLQLIIALLFANQIFLVSAGQRDSFFYVALINLLIYGLIHKRNKSFLTDAFVFLPLMITILFKPFFILHLICFYNFRKKNRSIPKWLKCTAVFAVAINLTFLNYWKYFISSILPFNWNYSIPAAEITFNNIFYVFSSLLFILSIWLSQRRIFGFRFRLLFNLLVALFLYGMQNKHFPYHTAGLELLLAMNIFFISKNFFTRKNVFIFCSFFACSILSSWYKRFLDTQHSFLRETTRELSILVEKYVAKGDYILPLTIETWVDYPLLIESDVYTSSRYLYQYNIVYFSTALTQDPKSQSTYAQKYIEELSADVAKTNPAAIYFTNRSYYSLLGKSKLSDLIFGSELGGILTDQYEKIKTSNQIYFYARKQKKNKAY